MEVRSTAHADDADYDSWLLLEAIEEIEVPIAMEEHVAAMEEE